MTKQKTILTIPCPSSSYVKFPGTFCNQTAPSNRAGHFPHDSNTAQKLSLSLTPQLTIKVDGPKNVIQLHLSTPCSNITISSTTSLHYSQLSTTLNNIPPLLTTQQLSKTPFQLTTPNSTQQHPSKSQMSTALNNSQQHPYTTHNSQQHLSTATLDGIPQQHLNQYHASITATTTTTTTTTTTAVTLTRKQ